jgi:hemerythrin-like domain-containing protein
MKELFTTPTAGFDEPFEMLAACHDRVRRSLDLLQRLVAHVREHGVDEQARNSARDVQRYFDIAAPAHHEDEERHVFPLLRESGDAALIETAARLHEDHAAMTSTWRLLGPRLQALSEGAFDGDVEALDAAASAFSALYEGHLALEDDIVFEVAQAATPTERQQAMGQEMAARRGVKRA